MKLQKDVIEKIFQHALKEYPYECCGIITGDKSTQIVHHCKNIQNQLHSENPVQYPRDARTAYLIERSEFDFIVNSAKEKNHYVVALYHSHCDHESYFSEEDMAAQTVFGEPELPDAFQIVVSVINGKINNTKCFIWSKELQHFVECHNIL